MSEDNKNAFKIIPPKNDEDVNPLTGHSKSCMCNLCREGAGNGTVNY